MTVKEATRLSKRHIQYRDSKGTLLPGVTTVVNQLDKPALAFAANKLGLQGIDSSAHWKGLAAIGSLAHKMLEHKLKGTDATEDLKDFTENEQSRARNSVARFDDWVKGRDFQFLDSEFPLVSEKWGYGGTGDCLAVIDGVLSYTDFKTGAIYLEAELQGAACAELLKEHGKDVKQIVLLGLPRGDDDTFHQKVITSWDTHFQMFRSLLDVYRIRQVLNAQKEAV